MTTPTLISALPLVKAPAAWPLPLVAGAAMLLLAVLDFAGALAAKEWADGGSPRWFFAGAACFLLLFYIYAASLQYGELATVTMGWIVLLQVGLLALDHVRYDVALPPARWAAIVVILALQAYLVLAPAASTSGAA